MTHTMDRLMATVERDATVPLDEVDKAVQAEWSGRSVGDVVGGEPGVLQASTPMMTLDRRAIEHNVEEMARWCATHRVGLAPHGKTTMAPALWLAQLEAGAWGITVATESQLRVAHAVGVPRVLLANMLIRPEGVRWLASALDDDDLFAAYTWVDSLAAVAAMDGALAGVPHRRRLRVLVELGAQDGRTGARTHEAGLAVAAAVVASPHLELAGVSGYEGVLAHSASPEDLAVVDQFLESMGALHDALVAHYETTEVVLTAGGSAYFDRVVDVLGSRATTDGTGGTGVSLVVRSGAYIVHDDGIYTELTPSASRPGPVFRSAMNVWARVISVPQPDIAYLDAGRRDVPVDEGWPVLMDARRRTHDGVEVIPVADHTVAGINDQHLRVAVPAGSALRVGDVVRLGVSHPCTTFDKWARIAVVDSALAPDPVVTDLIRTYF